MKNHKHNLIKIETLPSKWRRVAKCGDGNAWRYGDGVGVVGGYWKCSLLVLVADGNGLSGRCGWEK